jgi:DNA replication protein DnaC
VHNVTCSFGVGKTMIVKNVAQQALSHGHTVRFATASDMLAELAAQESSPALARQLRRYTLPDLLCVDEVGYLSYDSRYADLLFEVVTRRYDTDVREAMACANRGEFLTSAATEAFLNWMQGTGDESWRDELE